jgi:hypothetical protein
MIRIAITEAAAKAIAATLPFDGVAYETETTTDGQRFIWLEPRIVDKLKALRGPGESYSDVFLRLAADQGAQRGADGLKG